MSEYITREEKLQILKSLDKSDTMDKASNSVHLVHSVHSWPSPIPFEEMPLPSFPLEALPDTLRNFADAVSESIQTSVGMAAVSVLTVTALCIQGKFVIQGKPDWQEPLNLYVLTVAPPAERKSAVMALTTAPVYEWEKQENIRLRPMIDRNQLDKRVLVERIERLSKDAVKHKQSLPDLYKAKEELSNFIEIKEVRLLADDCTPEALISLLAENDSKMAIISSEGGIFEILAGRYSGSLNIDSLLKGHTGEPLRIDRKGRGTEIIENPTLTMLLSVQPTVLDGLISNPAFRGRGLTARFLYSIPKSPIGNRRFETTPIPKTVSDAYKSLCYELLNIPNEEKPNVIHLSPNAYQVSKEFFEILEPQLKDTLEDMSGWAGKLHGAILRIAGILHLCGSTAQRHELVSAETLQSAIEIGKYFLEHAKGAFRLMGADKTTFDAQYVLRRLQRQELYEISRRDLYRNCRGRFKKAEDMRPALDELISRNFIRVKLQKNSGPGRNPSPIFEINPEIIQK